MEGTLCVLRGTEVLLRGIKDYAQAVRLAKELGYTSSEPLAVVKVLYIAPNKG